MFLRQDQFDGVTRFKINCDIATWLNSRLSNSYATFFLKQNNANKSTIYGYMIQFGAYISLDRYRSGSTTTVYVR